MKNTEQDLLETIQNPVFRRLARELRDELPQYLEERARRIEERKKFVCMVWEKACLEAGLVKEKIK